MPSRRRYAAHGTGRALRLTYQAIDGYRARARAAALMHGLGFQRRATSNAAWPNSPGGWRRYASPWHERWAREADLLLLDERAPINLDLDAIVWLEEWLKGLPRHSADDLA